MAAVDVVSFSLTDEGGNVKAMPFHIPSGMTIANIQAGINAFAPALDACVSALLTGAQVTLQLTLPGGLKGAAGNNHVNEGALLSFDAVATSYAHSIFVPSWNDAGFTGNTVNNSGVYATLITDIISGLGTGGSELKPSDRYANDLVAFLSGKRRFRK